ncbi:MAG TPA: hypothetical protein VGQ59_11595 [Cyclobacteriaceae bacterium]|jgi:hypothetical protein|nr:hypothetical protein [Cyclobacteriaceae bacterium]
MRTIKSFSSFLCTFLALVLFSLSISTTMASPKDYMKGEQSISKKGTTPTSSDNQGPYEERETEKDDEVQDTFSLVCLICEPLFVVSIGDQDNCCDKAHKPVDMVTDIPLYLSQRVFLI